MHYLLIQILSIFATDNRDDKTDTGMKRIQTDTVATDHVNPMDNVPMAMQTQVTVPIQAPFIEPLDTDDFQFEQPTEEDDDEMALLEIAACIPAVRIALPDIAIDLDGFEFAPEEDDDEEFLLMAKKQTYTKPITLPMLEFIGLDTMKFEERVDEDAELVEALALSLAQLEIDEKRRQEKKPPGEILDARRMPEEIPSTSRMQRVQPVALQLERVASILSTLPVELAPSVSTSPAVSVVSSSVTTPLIAPPVSEIESSVDQSTPNSMSPQPDMEPYTILDDYSFLENNDFSIEKDKKDKDLSKDKSKCISDYDSMLSPEKAPKTPLKKGYVRFGYHDDKQSQKTGGMVKTSAIDALAKTLAADVKVHVPDVSPKDRVTEPEIIQSTGHRLTSTDEEKKEKAEETPTEPVDSRALVSATIVQTPDLVSDITTGPVKGKSTKVVTSKQAKDSVLSQTSISTGSVKVKKTKAVTKRPRVSKPAVLSVPLTEVVVVPSDKSTSELEHQKEPSEVPTPSSHVHLPHTSPLSTSMRQIDQPPPPQTDQTQLDESSTSLEVAAITGGLTQSSTPPSPYIGPDLANPDTSVSGFVPLSKPKEHEQPEVISKPVPKIGQKQDQKRDQKQDQKDSDSLVDDLTSDFGQMMSIASILKKCYKNLQDQNAITPSTVTTPKSASPTASDPSVISDSSPLGTVPMSNILPRDFDPESDELPPPTKQTEDAAKTKTATEKKDVDSSKSKPEDVAEKPKPKDGAKTKTATEKKDVDSSKSKPEDVAEKPKPKDGAKTKTATEKKDVDSSKSKPEDVAEKPKPKDGAKTKTVTEKKDVDSSKSKPEDVAEKPKPKDGAKTKTATEKKDVDSSKSKPEGVTETSIGSKPKTEPEPVAVSEKPKDGSKDKSTGDSTSC
ncbi:hypothetical protein M153_2200039623 [Pseudoloma neurophilia]|uniref:Uncharacterized protein n=1 Tax=Pseudoloma neurophilia TaxID=146866 RepID=A0A0R0M811_9MICR|nr:hypothetical protein M153_2200039623 [Pseudoloma neurophilia]